MSTLAGIEYYQSDRELTDLLLDGVREGLWPFRPPGDILLMTELDIDFNRERLLIEFDGWRGIYGVIYYDHALIDVDPPAAAAFLGQTAIGVFRRGFEVHPRESNLELGEN